MTGIANHTRQPDPERFGQSVGSVSQSICGLIESAAQASYLIGVSDPTSVAGRPGLVDQSQFGRGPRGDPAGVYGADGPRQLTAAGALGGHPDRQTHVSALYQLQGGQWQVDKPGGQEALCAGGQDVANATAALVKEIKELDKDYSDANGRGVLRPLGR